MLAASLSEDCGPGVPTQTNAMIPPEAVKAGGFIPECRYQQLQKGDIAQGCKKMKIRLFFNK